jgi:DNA/RNA-binding domain of Phe-tRNA-synthetase-like protein
MTASARVGPVELELATGGVSVGLVYAEGCVASASPPELISQIRKAVALVGEASEAQAKTKAVRDMLRHGKYKPTGRGKPASEYLQRAATQDQFPEINNLVDMINLISFEHFLPISLIDLGRAGSNRLRLRWGHEGESYVFNNGGQSIGLHDLLLVAALPEDRPCANPVKDSMATKLTEESKRILAVIYAPEPLVTDLAGATSELEKLFARFSGAPAVAATVASTN